MAIVEMKRVSLLALRADRDRLLRAMQRMGCVEITEIQDEQLKAYLGRERGQAENAEEKLSRIKWAISLLSRYEVKKKSLLNMFSSIPDATEEEAQAVADDAQSVMAAVEACEACERREGDLRGREADAVGVVHRLRHVVQQLVQPRVKFVNRAALLAKQLVLNTDDVAKRHNQLSFYVRPAAQYACGRNTP